MSEETLHDQLIAELLEGRVNLTPREHAARNEILGLRERLARLDGSALTAELSKTVTTETDNLKGVGKVTS